MQNIHVSDQYAVNSAKEKSAISDSDRPVIESALQHANMKTLAVRTSSGQGVTLTEMPVTGLLVLRTRSEQAVLANALNETLKLSLPGVLASNTQGSATGSTTASSEQKLCLRWIAPDEWLLSCPLQDAFAIEQQLRAACGDASMAIVNVSGGFTLLKLHGANANDVLKKSTGYDVHPSNFYAGKVVNTTFAKAQVTMSCIDVNQYELIVRRSFADYIWHWIQVACTEYGLSIEIE